MGGLGVAVARALANPSCKKFASAKDKIRHFTRAEYERSRIPLGSARGEPARCPHLEGIGRNSARVISFTSSSLSITGKYKSVVPERNNFSIRTNFNHKQNLTNGTRHNYCSSFDTSQGLFEISLKLT